MFCSRIVGELRLCGRIDGAATKRLGKTLASGGDKQARVEDSGASAQDPSSPRESEPASVDDEVNMEMELEGSVKSQAEQAAEVSRRRQRDQLEAALGHLLSQMRITMEEVIRREKAETWERVAQIEKKVDHHESKIKEHDEKFLDLESEVAELRSRPSMTKSFPAGKDSETSTRASGSAEWVEQHVAFQVCDYEERSTRGTRRPEIESFRNAIVDKVDPCYQSQIFEPSVLATDNYRFTMVRELRDVITSMIEERTEGLSIKNIAGRDWRHSHMHAVIVHLFSQ